MTEKYPKRLIEVDLPIRRISEHGKREKFTRHGHISALHIWWARRPLAACRAVICAALWHDPADPLCPAAFKDKAKHVMLRWARDGSRLASPESFQRLVAIQKDASKLDDPEELRVVLLDFIADFANWDNSTSREYLQTSRTLTQAAHEALGGTPGTRPIVADPFAGGGAFPLEAARVGGQAYAGELNSLAATLNQLILEYCPSLRGTLVSAVERWGKEYLTSVRKRLSDLYPKEKDGASVICYFWARTVVCEGPGCGVSIPVIRHFQFAWRPGNEAAVEIYYVKKKLHTRLHLGASAKKRDGGTSRRGSVTCPFCGFTMPRKNVERQAKTDGFGYHLFAVCSRGPSDTKKQYREPNDRDYKALAQAAESLKSYRGRQLFDDVGFIPEEELPYLRSIFNVRVYGIDQWNKLFTERQLVSAIEHVCALRQISELIVSAEENPRIREPVIKCLALAVSNGFQYQCNISTYLSDGIVSAFIQGQSLGMKMDFVEANPLVPELVGGFEYSLNKILSGLQYLASFQYEPGEAHYESALNAFLPEDSNDLLATDPPYYDVIPYADCSDFFHVWLRRMLFGVVTSFFDKDLSRKDEEIVQLAERNEKYRNRTKDWFEKKMAEALEKWRVATKPMGGAVIVFAHKDTSAWEALLQAVLAAGWAVTASWPLDTENTGRMRARDSAVLSSSIHLFCRPRESLDGAVVQDEICDWRDVLQELPRRIHEWMPRLAKEGVVGADAIFACLGPALEIFSRYSRVEKASGEAVTLKEYLEHVWAAVAKEALTMVFEGADATGFEADARLTAMWLWTLNANSNGQNSDEEADEDSDDESEGGAKKPKLGGFVLEYDAARKIAQGLGAHLEDLGSLVEVSGEQARLLPVAERARHLFGKDEGKVAPQRKKREPQMNLFKVLEEANEAESSFGEAKVSRLGETVLDQVHQSMILFATNRNEALKRFLVDDGVGGDQRFWRLADCLCKLYPARVEEKRWVEGVLARKKGLGF